MCLTCERHCGNLKGEYMNLISSKDSFKTFKTTRQHFLKKKQTFVSSSVCVSFKLTVFSKQLDLINVKVLLVSYPFFCQTNGQ